MILNVLHHNLEEGRLQDTTEETIDNLYDKHHDDDGRVACVIMLMCNALILSWSYLDLVLILYFRWYQFYYLLWRLSV